MHLVVGRYFYKKTDTKLRARREGGGGEKRGRGACSRLLTKDAQKVEYGSITLSKPPTVSTTRALWHAG